VKATQVPSRLRRHAFEVGNGELLWSGPAAITFSDWLARRGLGILGGEVYRTGLRLGWGTFDKAWDTEPGWRPGEPWKIFVERGRAQSLAHIQSETADAGSTGGDPALFFLAACQESDYAHQWYGPFSSPR
jgi:hypothetical protein